jgi:hypothetical protein
MTTDTLRFEDYPVAAVRLPMIEWMERHGINHDLVPIPCTITRHLLPDLPGISYPLYVTDDNGSIQLTPDLLAAQIEDVWLPMEANPLPFPAAVVGPPLNPEEQQP